jgi:hypothetical protein
MDRREYNSLDDFIKACNVTNNGNNVRIVYNNAQSVVLNFHKFSFSSSKQYTFVFGSRAGRCQIVGNGSNYSNITFEIQKRTNEYDLQISKANFENVNSVIKSDASRLNLSFLGDTIITVKTTKASNGEAGKSYGMSEYANGGAGGNGEDANPAILCNGKLSIICSTTVILCGGDGGDGGRGGDAGNSATGISIGGRGGDGGDGAFAIYASSVEVTFADGAQPDKFTVNGGKGGRPGAGGMGKFMYIYEAPAESGEVGAAAAACNVTIRYN